MSTTSRLLFFLVHRAKPARHANDHARACALPSLNLRKKRDRSQSKRTKVKLILLKRKEDGWQRRYVLVSSWWVFCFFCFPSWLWTGAEVSSVLAELLSPMTVLLLPLQMYSALYTPDVAGDFPSAVAFLNLLLRSSPNIRLIHYILMKEKRTSMSVWAL